MANHAPNNEVPKVKLNDPLMGTETCSNKLAKYSPLTVAVKLNDPLMGTETLYIFR